MQDFRIYGLDETGAVSLSETIPQMSFEQLRAIARGKLEHCDEIEVWQGPVRVLTLRRD